MQATVTEKGIVIPKEFLEGINKVEIVREGDRIVIVPVVQEDPLWNIGSEPVTCGTPDASQNLDQHLYNSI